MRLKVVSEVVEVPDNVGEQCLKQQAENEASRNPIPQTMDANVWWDEWSYTIKVPFRWERA